MTRVSFYLLADNGDEAALRFACRLAEKAHGEQHRVFLRVPDDDTGARLDALLWTFRQGSFVPHARAQALQADDPTPVVIGDHPPDEQNDVLINLGADVPGFFSRFSRTVEVVTPDARADARQRYRFYADRGYALETHEIA